MKNIISVCEIREEDAYPLFCPFCGTMVQDLDSNQEPKVTPCPHTLFVCHDMGWQYVSDRMHSELKRMRLRVSDDETEAVMALPGAEEDADDCHFDDVTSRVTIPGSQKFAAYQGPPSFYGGYVGFAPLPNESEELENQSKGKS